MNPDKPTISSLDPFKSHPDNDKSRFISNVPTKIYNHFYGIHTKRGVQQTTVNIILKQIYDKCLSLGITPGSPNSSERYLELLTGLRVEFSGSSSGSVVGTTKTQNDRPTTSRSNSTSASTPNSSTIVPSKSAKRVRRTRSKNPEDEQNK